METIKNVKVSNAWGVPNQFSITTDDGEYFQSYESIIAFIPNGRNFPTKEEPIYLDENTWDYSTTTGKYRNKFLGEDKKETERKIKEGIYKLINLN